jgi:hypothetical protein
MQAIEVSEKTSESRLKKSKKGNELFTPDCTAYIIGMKLKVMKYKSVIGVK